MSRVPAAALALVALLALAGCADNILKERPVQRVVKAPVESPAFSAVGAAKGQSSVCAAYRRQLAQVQRLRQRPRIQQNQTDLKGRELSLNAVIADACE